MILALAYESNARVIHRDLIEKQISVLHVVLFSLFSVSSRNIKHAVLDVVQPLVGIRKHRETQCSRQGVYLKVKSLAA